eukprot:g57729.t1
MHLECDCLCWLHKRRSIAGTVILLLVSSFETTNLKGDIMIASSLLFGAFTSLAVTAQVNKNADLSPLQQLLQKEQVYWQNHNAGAAVDKTTGLLQYSGWDTGNGWTATGNGWGNIPSSPVTPATGGGSSGSRGFDYSKQNYGNGNPAAGSKYAFYGNTCGDGIYSYATQATSSITQCQQACDVASNDCAGYQWSEQATTCVLYRQFFPVSNAPPSVSSNACYKKM